MKKIHRVSIQIQPIHQHRLTGFGITEKRAFVYLRVISGKDTEGIVFSVDSRSLALMFRLIKLFSCSTQLIMKIILLINVKMPRIGNLTFISRINNWLW